VPSDPGAVRAALRSLALHGVPGAAADAATGSDAGVRASLRRQAHRIVAVAAGRVAAAADAPEPMDVLRAVFGADVVALPRLAAPDAVALRSAMTAREAAGDAAPGAVTDWVADCADVRTRVARLQDLRFAAAACGRGDASLPRVAQLPPPPGGGTDRWAALPLPVTQPPATQAAGLVDLVLTGPALDPPTAPDSDVLAGPLTGLLVDEWVEVVPSRTITGALTFHVDAPGGSPPQSVLLAVAPDPNQPWDVDLLEQTVLDVLRLAQGRMVDPDLVPVGGHVLPALMLARNTGEGGLGDTIATAFPQR
jgi:hypothetical protein